MEKMKNSKIRCWNKTDRRMKWRLALRIATTPSEKWFVKAAEWNPELSSGPTERLGDQEEDWKTTSTSSSNLKKMRPKTSLKAAANSTKHGSMQQKTVEDGPYSKTNSQ